MRLQRLPCFILVFAFQIPAGHAGKPAEGSGAVGWVERMDPRMDLFFEDEVEVEELASGFSWAEGPLWLREEAALLFSDVPENVVWRWSEADGLSEYLRPSGSTGAAPGGEQGANGLLLNADGQLLLCQHGDRRIARMDADLTAPREAYITLAASFEGRRFNSPNDAVMNRRGQLWFTDPSYGLPQEVEPELPFAGVYRLDADGQLSLVTKDLEWPNGVALSPDESVLYIANSDRAAARYFACELNERGELESMRLLFDATALVGAENPGIPDGLAVHPSGVLFATGPGGVLVLSPEGEHLGTIRTTGPTANCAFDADYKALYLTAGSRLLRVKLR